MAKDPQPARPRPSVALIGDDDKPRSEFEIGESIAIVARGLQPATAHDIKVQMRGRDGFSLRLASDGAGTIEGTVIWPQLGLADPWSDELYSPQEAVKRWGGGEIEVAVGRSDKILVKTKVRIATAAARPLVLVSDAEGRPLNAIEPKRARPHVLLQNLPFTGLARVMIVHRQHDWHPGTPLPLATMIDGRPAVMDVEIDSKRRALVPLRPAPSLPPGAYDLIVREIRYGFEADERLVLTARDLIGGRRITGLVVREIFEEATPLGGATVNMLPISGRQIAEPPYFHFTDTFEIGEDVWGGLDPGIVDPGNHSKMCALYVIANKDAGQWSNNNLVNLPILGGNPAVPKFFVQPLCINWNRVKLWTAASQIGDYDIVADFGNNTGSTSSFVPDDKFDSPLDIIDGYFAPGFRIVEDPGTLSEWADIGNWNYTETSKGSVTVQDENSFYSTPGGFMLTAPMSVPHRAHVYFPADAPGATAASQISAAKADYPLVVIVHGNGHSYTSYDFLLQHLARNGFVAASIHLNNGMMGLGRAKVLFSHLALLNAEFGAKLQNHIGLMGHSRGGEAVIKAARLNQQNALGHGIDCLISLAPTDHNGHEVLAAPWATPYFVLYGSRDGDVAGHIYVSGYTVPQTGFALYDRASGAPKHMVFVHRASHNGFITANENFTGEASVCVAPADQQKVTLAYMNAFFRTYLKADDRWTGMFNGEWKPPSVSVTGAKLYVQSRQPGQRVIDDFESGAGWTVSSSGGSVTETGLPATPAEGRLCHNSSAAGLDPQSPHDSNGQRLRWDTGADRIEWTIPPGQRNVSSFAAVSLRIGQMAGSASNPANLAQKLRLALRDGSNNERAVKVDLFYELPYPDVRPNATLTKSAMLTVRIPLDAYTIRCQGLVEVDLTDVAALALLFTETPSGEIDIDDIEFTI